MTFVDLTKAFDTVSCDGPKFGCPPRFKVMMQQFHPCSGDKWCQARLCDGNNSVQMMVSTMLMEAFQVFDADFPIRHRLNSKLLNLRDC